MSSALNFRQYEPGELDKIVVQRPFQHGQSNLLFAMLAAILVHLVILGFWKLDHSRAELFPTLKVSLLPIVGKPVPLVDAVYDSPAETVSEIVEPVREPMPWIPPVDLSREEDRPKVGQLGPNETLSGFLLYNKAIEIVREGSLPQKTSYRTFSTRDFPRAEEKNPFQSKEYIPVMISEPRRMEQKDQLGYYTIKKSNGFGKSICYQQRGFAGDGNPPLWYRVPASTCGHIK